MTGLWLEYISSHSMLVVEFLSTSFEAKMGFICMILKCRKHLNLHNTLDFHIVTIEGSDVHEIAMFYFQKKTPFTN
jgi:hypothetical protein